MIKNWIVFIAFFVFVSCSSTNMQQTTAVVESEQENSELAGYQKAYFASGCFWCVEAIFESLNGVEEVVSGYAGGEIVNPTYEQVGAGRTRHAEAVEIYYDPHVINYATLVKVFFGSHDPTTRNRQGPDAGPQYRSAIFYQTPKELEIITGFIKRLEKSGEFINEITTEVSPFNKFYDAEDYHQNFEQLHPDHPYVKAVSVPRLEKAKEKFPDLLK